jgi:hypothetical protein
MAQQHLKVLVEKVVSGIGSPLQTNKKRLFPEVASNNYYSEVAKCLAKNYYSEVAKSLANNYYSEVAKKQLF